MVMGLLLHLLQCASPSFTSLTILCWTPLPPSILCILPVTELGSGLQGLKSRIVVIKQAHAGRNEIELTGLRPYRFKKIWNASGCERSDDLSTLILKINDRKCDWICYQCQTSFGSIFFMKSNCLSICDKSAHCCFVLREQSVSFCIFLDTVLWVLIFKEELSDTWHWLSVLWQSCCHQSELNCLPSLYLSVYMSVCLPVWKEYRPLCASFTGIGCVLCFIFSLCLSLSLFPLLLSQERVL